MSAFLACLYKEYRDKRTGIIGLLVIIVGFAALSGFVLEEYWIDRELLRVMTHGVLFVAAIMFASDLSEQRSETLGFVRRLPNGLERAFWAKVVFLLLVLSGTTAFAFAVTWCCREVFATDATVGGGVDEGPALWMWSCVIAVSFWMMAVSSWLSRSMLALPASLLLLALIGLPGGLMLSDKLPALPTLPLVAMAVAHPFVALWVAWLSFARGRRHGGNAWSSAWRGLVGAGVGCLCLSLIAAGKVEEWQEVDLSEGRVQSAYLGADGTRLFLNWNRHQDWPWHAVMLDLRSGRVQPLATGMSAVSPIQVMWSLHSRPARLLRMWRGDESGSFVDSITGEVLGHYAKHARWGDMIERCRDSVRHSSWRELPDGRRYWWFRGSFEVESEDGKIETLLSGNAAEGWFPNYTGSFALSGRGWLFDLVRGERYSLKAYPHSPYVLGDAWLIPWKPRKAIHGCGDQWMITAPGSLQVEPAKGMRDGDIVRWVFPDSTVLVCPSASARSDGEEQVWYRVDPVGGARQPLGVHGASAPEIARQMESNRLQCLGTTQSGTLLARSFMNFALRKGASEFLAFHGDLIGVDEQDRAFVFGPSHTTIERVDLRTGDREVVYVFARR